MTLTQVCQSWTAEGKEAGMLRCELAEDHGVARPGDLRGHIARDDRGRPWTWDSGLPPLPYVPEVSEPTAEEVSEPTAEEVRAAALAMYRLCPELSVSGASDLARAGLRAVAALGTEGRS